MILFSTKFNCVVRGLIDFLDHTYFQASPIGGVGGYYPPTPLEMVQKIS